MVGMVTSLATVAIGLSIGAVVIAVVRMGTIVLQLQARLDEEDSAVVPASPQRPMLSGLYPTVAPGSDEPGLPGMRWLIGAAALGMIGLLIGLAPQRTPAPPVAPEIAILDARIDSLTVLLAQRDARDSVAALKSVLAPPAPGRAAPRPTVAVRVLPAAVTPPALSLPDSSPIRIPGQ